MIIIVWIYFRHCNEVFSRSDSDICEESLTNSFTSHSCCDSLRKNRGVKALAEDTGGKLETCTQNRLESSPSNL